MKDYLVQMSDNISFISPDSIKQQKKVFKVGSQELKVDISGDDGEGSDGYSADENGRDSRTSRPSGRDSKSQNRRNRVKNTSIDDDNAYY